MLFDKNLVREKMLNWESLLQSHSLPEWEQFPTLPLYMDQVVYLLNQYLSPLPDEGEERAITPAMINNYVKLKIIPAPVKKRYSREHLAYLVMVCVMKQTLNTADIRRLLPGNPDEDMARDTYNTFLHAIQRRTAAFAGEVRRAAEPILEAEDAPVSQLIFMASAAANLNKMLAEQLIRLREEEPAEPSPK